MCPGNGFSYPGAISGEGGGIDLSLQVCQGTPLNHTLFLTFRDRFLLKHSGINTSIYQTKTCHTQVKFPSTKVICNIREQMFYHIYYKKHHQSFLVQTRTLTRIASKTYFKTKCKLAESRGSVNCVVLLLWSTK